MLITMSIVICVIMFAMVIMLSGALAIWHRVKPLETWAMLSLAICLVMLPSAAQAIIAIYAMPTPFLQAMLAVGSMVANGMAVLVAVLVGEWHVRVTELRFIGHRSNA